MASEQTDRAFHLRPRQTAESETTKQVVDPAVGKVASQEVTHLRGRPGDRAAAGFGLVEFLREYCVRIGWPRAVAVPQLQEAGAPLAIGRARSLQCLLVGLRHH